MSRQEPFFGDPDEEDNGEDWDFMSRYGLSPANDMSSVRNLQRTPSPDGKMFMERYGLAVESQIEGSVQEGRSYPAFTDPTLRPTDSHSFLARSLPQDHPGFFDGDAFQRPPAYPVGGGSIESTFVSNLFPTTLGGQADEEEYSFSKRQRSVSLNHTEDLEGISTSFENDLFNPSNFVAFQHFSSSYESVPLYQRFSKHTVCSFTRKYISSQIATNT